MNDPIHIALYFLKFRPRSVFEIQKKLESKSIDGKEIKKTISVLKRNKLLDDGNFAKMYVRDKNLLRPSGSFLLKLELKKLGISDQDIDTALEGQDEADIQEKLAREAIEGKSRYRNADFNKQAAFLQRRGFSPNIIYSILKK